MTTKIETKLGNLLDVAKGHVVHGCNAQGVMGSGVALGIRLTYPEAFDDYSHIHKTEGLFLGKAYPVFINQDLTIWNAITQHSYGAGRRHVSYDAVETCFSQVNRFIRDNSQGDADRDTVHIPMIGAARGGGNWEIIREIIEQTMDYPVVLWLPDNSVTTL